MEFMVKGDGMTERSTKRRERRPRQARHSRWKVTNVLSAVPRRKKSKMRLHVGHFIFISIGKFLRNCAAPVSSAKPPLRLQRQRWQIGSSEKEISSKETENCICIKIRLKCVCGMQPPPLQTQTDTHLAAALQDITPVRQLSWPELRPHLFFQQELNVTSTIAAGKLEKYSFPSNLWKKLEIQTDRAWNVELPAFRGERILLKKKMNPRLQVNINTSGVSAGGSAAGVWAACTEQPESFHEIKINVMMSQFHPRMLNLHGSTGREHKHHELQK